MYRIDAGTFRLEFMPEIYEQDLAYPVNVKLRVSVFSSDYAVDSFMDVGVQGIAGFAVQLNALYETLTGRAELEEPYSVHNYIAFSAKTGGHIRVTGRLNNKNAYGYTQEILFENEIDQTHVREFAKRLLADFGKYAE